MGESLESCRIALVCVEGNTRYQSDLSFGLVTTKSGFTSI